MSNALEIKLRTQVVNAKITYAVEVQSVLRDLLTEVRDSHCSYDPPACLFPFSLPTRRHSIHTFILVLNPPYGTDHYRSDRS